MTYMEFFDEEKSELINDLKECELRFLEDLFDELDNILSQLSWMVDGEKIEKFMGKFGGVLYMYAYSLVPADKWEVSKNDN